MKKEERRILSVQEILHLQSDKHEKKSDVMPEIDTSKFVLNQKPKVAVRTFAPTVKISDEQRRQFSQGDTALNREAVLAEQARRAIELAELHAKEEADEQTKASSAAKTEKSSEETKKLVKEIKTGNFELGFGMLIEGSEDLKETI